MDEDAMTSFSERAVEAAKKAAPKFWQQTSDFDKHMAKCLTAALAVDGPSNLRHFVLSHWDNQDMSHVDFRVHAYQIAAASDGEVG
jgi:hypothetical protein